MLTREKLLHPATIVATIALLVALSGAGYAATKIGTGQLRNGAVTRAKIKNNAITASKIAAGAVAARDLARGSVTAGKLAPGAVTTPGLANGSVTQGKLGANAVTGAALANGSVTNAKLGPNAVTGAKIAGATITAANIQNGQVVKGSGNLLSTRVLLPAGAVDTTVLTLPGIGAIRASCVPAGEATSFINQSGSAVGVTAWGARPGLADPAAVFQQNTLANGLSTSVSSGPGGAQGVDWQISYADAAGTNQIATVSVSLLPAPPNCIATAQALTTS
jgi:hypothetical protein